MNNNLIKKLAEIRETYIFKKSEEKENKRRTVVRSISEKWTDEEIDNYNTGKIITNIIASNTNQLGSVDYNNVMYYYDSSNVKIMTEQEIKMEILTSNAYLFTHAELKSYKSRINSEPTYSKKKV